MSPAPALTFAAAYLLGSIPFSFLVARFWGIEDVRRVGSGNVGATNVLRAAGTTAGLLAFLLDASKGAVAALATQRLEAGALLPSLAASAAVLGHMFPVWLGFRGGKGVATGAGAFLPLAPAATGLALGAFAVALLVTRYVSLGSITGALCLAVFSFVFGAPAAVAWSATAMAVLIVWKHRGNLERIAKGTERRLGARSS